MTETWLPVVGWPGYEVSDLGHARSVDRVIECADGRTRRFRGQPLMVQVDERGYHRVTLWCGGQSEGRTIHSMVAEAFIGPCPPGHEVRHENGDNSQNGKTNLLYGTKSENMQDAVRHGTHANLCKRKCKRQHLLEPPNLVASKWRDGVRECLACARARAWIQTHPEEDVADVSHDYYKKIMEGVG